MKPVYEVVTGQILLSRRQQFFELHQGFLLPAMKEIGIRPVLLLITELGRYGRFLDVYEYDTLAQYEELTDRLIELPQLEKYYREVGDCVQGSISVEIMTTLPYAHDWQSSL